MTFRLFGTDKRYMLLIDVAAGSVGMAVSRHRHGHASHPRIVAQTRKPIHFKGTTSAEALTAALEAALQDAGSEIQKALARASISPEEVDTHAVIHAPWGTAQTETAMQEYPDPVSFNIDFFHTFLKEAFPALRDTRHDIAAAYVMRLELNGYPIEVPQEVRAHSVAATILFLHMHPSVMRTIQTFVVRYMHTEPAYLASFSYAVTALAATYGNSIPEYTIVDAGEVFSQMSVIRDGVIQQQGEIAFGLRDIYTAIAKRMRVSEAVARSRMRMFQEGTLVPTGRRQIRSVLQTQLQQWTRAFGDTCATLAREAPLPEVIFLFTDDLLYPFMREQLGRIDFAPFTVTARPFVVRPLLDAGAIKKHVAPTVRMPDARLALDALFVDLHAPQLEKNALLHPMVTSLLHMSDA